MTKEILQSKIEFKKLKLNNSEILEGFRDTNKKDMNKNVRYAVECNVLLLHEKELGVYWAYPSVNRQLNKRIRFYYPYFILYHYKLDLYNPDWGKDISNMKSHQLKEAKKFGEFVRQYTLSEKIKNLKTKIGEK